MDIHREPGVNGRRRVVQDHQSTINPAIRRHQRIRIERRAVDRLFGHYGDGRIRTDRRGPDSEGVQIDDRDVDDVGERACGDDCWSPHQLGAETYLDGCVDVGGTVVDEHGGDPAGSCAGVPGEDRRVESRGLTVEDLLDAGSGEGLVQVGIVGRDPFEVPFGVFVDREGDLVTVVGVQVVLEDRLDTIDDQDDGESCPKVGSRSPEGDLGAAGVAVRFDLHLHREACRTIDSGLVPNDLRFIAEVRAVPARGGRDDHCEDLTDRWRNGRGVVGDVTGGHDLDAGLFADPVLVHDVAVVDVDVVHRVSCRNAVVQFHQGPSGGTVDFDLRFRVEDQLAHHARVGTVDDLVGNKRELAGDGLGLRAVGLLDRTDIRIGLVVNDIVAELFRVTGRSEPVREDGVDVVEVHLVVHLVAETVKDRDVGEVPAEVTAV